MAMSSAEKAKCEAWVRDHAMSWQTLSRSQWTYQFHEKTLVRFVEDASMDEDMVRLLLEYLSSSDCIATLHLYDQTIDESWKPIRAWYEVSNQSHGKIHAMRLYHGIRTELGAGGDGPYIVEDGCVYDVYTTYYWKQASVIPVPPSSSGVSYRIVGLTRDSETGLFSYGLEKRTRSKQSVPEYTSKSTKFETVRKQAHFGVKQGTFAGKSASWGGGTVVTREVSKNSDCTSDVHNVTTTEKPVKGAVLEVARTLRATTTTVMDKSQVNRLDKKGIAVGERRSSRMTEGGRYDNTKTTVDVTPPGKLHESDENTVFENRHSQLEVTPAKTLPASGVKAQTARDGVVQRIDVKRNEDGASMDLTTAVVTEKPVENAVVEVQSTLRGVRKTTTSRNQREPAVQDGELDIKSGTSIQTRVTNGGLYDNTVTKFDAAASQSLSRVCQSTSAVHTEVVTATVPLDSSGMPEGTIGLDGHTTAGPNVEVSQRWRKNEDGQTADVEVSTKTYAQLQGEVKVETGGGVTSTTTIKENVGFSGDTVTGKTVDMTTGLKNGGRTGSSGANTPEAVWTGGYILQPNGDLVYQVLEVSGGEGNEDNSVIDPRYTKVPGRVNGTVNSPGSVGVHATKQGPTVSTLHEWAIANGGGEGVRQKDQSAEKASVNKDVRTSVVPNGHGTYTYQKTVTEYEEVDSDEREWFDADGNRHVQRVYLNSPVIKMPVVEGDGPRNVSFHPSGHGSWNGSYSFVEPNVYKGYSRKNLIIDADVDVTYSRTRHYGRWTWQTGVLATAYITQVWRYLRVARGRYRYVNMNYKTAERCADALKRLFTRDARESEWQEIGFTAGTFQHLSGGKFRSTGVHIYRIAKNIYGVRVDVNEVEELLDRGVYNPEQLFQERKYYL